MADRYLCRGCSKVITATKNGRYRTHTDGDGNPCGLSSGPIPADLIAQGPEEKNAALDVPVEGRDFATCSGCRRRVKLTGDGEFQPHDQTMRGGIRCETRKRETIELPKENATAEPAQATEATSARPTTNKTAEGVAECPASGVRHARKEEVIELPEEPLRELGKAFGRMASTSTVPISKSASAESSPTELRPTSGITEGVTTSASRDESSAPSAGSSASTETPSPVSPTTLTPSPQPEPELSPTGPFSLGTALSDRFLQPFSPFLQPGDIPPKVKASETMTDRGKEIAARLKEIFYAYSNRKTSDNRTAQTTLGPSEIGTPCDRRLAMSLMGVEPVNPGGDGWAAFVGTAIHASLDDMFTWASAGSGRFATEMKLQFGSALVPKGTGDLLDRVLCMFLDHKCMGKYSLKKLRESGPSDTYRVQIHTYAYGAILAGEKVKDVAIIAWPREGSSLDELYVWTEKYDKKVAVDAMARVERIATETRSRQHGIDHGHYSKLEVAKTFPVADPYECRFCPFHLKGDTEMKKGCPGK